MGNHEAVRKLLRCGANLGLKNWKGETPIVHIAPTIMEEYLDDCLEGEGLTTDDKFKITFKYHFLGPPKMREEDKQPLLGGKVALDLHKSSSPFLPYRRQRRRPDGNCRRQNLSGIWHR